ncbi:PREDICTED: uncharacterized protein LOC109474416 [Branchiostoma belcheri]|uniref:Uncharacterized protein LOC109474416 n=1 Tax=Branchiostoma belcheri TaxID=7741 RepID=A0A6P4YLC6_BRABE|nr:PREDICTED: uncharacterized protein LOC109474416 [Branchiostoma belcheri]
MESWRVWALFLIISVTCVDPSLSSSACDAIPTAILRLNFAGKFLADVSTYNNDLQNFNISTFDPLKYPHWNPKGTADFRLVYCNVTQVCYGDKGGECVDDHEKDSIVGQPIIGSDSTTTGKLVDLDPDDQTQSQIWGLVVGVDGFFKGDFAPRSFNHMHHCKEGARSDLALCAVFLSTLQNVKWLNGLQTSQSEFALQVKSLSRKDGFQLYIKLNVYNMDVNSTSPDFPYGRVVGTVYAKVSKTPHPYGPYNRMLWDPRGGGHVPFYVDTNNNDVKVVLDFGNSLKLDVNGSVVESSDGPLHLLQYKGKDLNCGLLNNRGYDLGKIRLGGNDWFQTTGGIVELSVNPEDIETIENTPLTVIQVNHSINYPRHCEPVLEERPDGLFVQAIDDRVARQEPDTEWTMKFRTFQFGRSAKEIITRPNQTSPENDTSIQIVRTEPSDINGISSITFRSTDPGEPRKELQLDGQVYYYSIIVQKGSDGTEFEVKDLFVCVHLYSEYTIPKEVTWYDHVYPIFLQYANLYPAMKQIINLASYEDVTRKTKLLKHALTLPETDPNHMPVTRDLSPKKRQMILYWLDNVDPSTKLPKLGTTTHTLDELKTTLQLALQLELATIPPYLSALFSIKDGDNEEVAALIGSVVLDEMKHVALVANVLNAIGGAPNLNDRSVFPLYPAPLPGGANPGLVVKLARCSLNQIRTVFQGIERPNCNQKYSDVIQYLRRNKKYIINLRHGNDDDNGHVHTWTEISERCKEITTRPQTIGAIYIHQILCPMVTLHKQGKSPFRGDKAKQITGKQWLSNVDSVPFAVHDLRSAVAAIVDIATEGEGTDPCDPFDERNDVSHFFKFAEVVHGRKLKMINETAPDKSSLAHFFENFFECYEDMNCTTAFGFIGKIVPFYEDGVWPTISNPHTKSYPKKSQARQYSDNFNMIYTGLLMCLHEAFNGKPDKIKECTGMMSSLHAWGKKLVQTPIDPNGDPEIGPNAAPTFEFYEFEPIDKKKEKDVDSTSTPRSGKDEIMPESRMAVTVSSSPQNHYHFIKILHNLSAIIIVPAPWSNYQAITISTKAVASSAS